MVYYSVLLAVHLNYAYALALIPNHFTLPFPPSNPSAMAEKDSTTRLRRAVKGSSCARCSGSWSRLALHANHVRTTPENNLFLVKRLIKRTDIRNPDPTHKRYTSLAWAAVLGHEETFEFLLSSGHDDRERSKVCTTRTYFRTYLLNPLCTRILRTTLSLHSSLTRKLPS